MRAVACCFRESEDLSFLVELIQIVGDGVLNIPSAEGRQVGMRKDLPIEVKSFRRIVGGADPYGRDFRPVRHSGFFLKDTALATKIWKKPNKKNRICASMGANPVFYQAYWLNSALGIQTRSSDHRWGRTASTASVFSRP